MRHVEIPGARITHALFDLAKENILTDATIQFGDEGTGIHYCVVVSLSDELYTQCNDDKMRLTNINFSEVNDKVTQNNIVRMLYGLDYNVDNIIAFVQILRDLNSCGFHKTVRSLKSELEVRIKNDYCSAIALYDYDQCDNDLRKKCEEEIEIHSVWSYSVDEAFSDVSYSTIERILQLNHLPYTTPSETQFFRVALRWAEKACLKKKLEVNGGNKRKMLGNSLFNLRLGTIGSVGLATDIFDSGVLTHEELLNLFVASNGGKASTRYDNQDRDDPVCECEFEPGGKIHALKADATRGGLCSETFKLSIAFNVTARFIVVHVRELASVQYQGSIADGAVVIERSKPVIRHHLEFTADVQEKWVQLCFPGPFAAGINYNVRVTYDSFRSGETHLPLYSYDENRPYRGSCGGVYFDVCFPSAAADHRANTVVHSLTPFGKASVGAYRVSPPPSTSE